MSKDKTLKADSAAHAPRGVFIPADTPEGTAGLVRPSVIEKAVDTVKSAAQTIAAAVVEAVTPVSDGTVTLVYPTFKVPGCLVLNAAPGATFDASQHVTVAVPVEEGCYESIVVAGNRIK